MTKITGHTIKGYKKSDNPVVRAMEKDTLYLPGLYGQWMPWMKKISPVVSTVDTCIQMGNIIGLNDDVMQFKHGNRGYNSVIVDNIFNNWVHANNESDNVDSADTASNFTQWVQLVGAHEIIALTDKDNEVLDDYSAQLLRENYFSKDSPFVFAYAHNERLVTHGGLTHGLWEELGKPKTAKKAADLINKKYQHQLYFSNSLRVGSPPNFSADPVFVDDVQELYPSWIYAKEKCPFEQVFAQTINSIRGRLAKGSEYSSLYWLDDSCFLYPRFGSIVNIRDTQFFGLDISLNAPRKSTVNTAHKMWIEKSFG